MKKHFIVLVMLISYCSTYAQEDVNKLFKIKLNVIGRLVMADKWNSDTSYCLDYSIENISNDTLVYVTNSCFYYNHYSLKTTQQEFDLNAKGDCIANALTYHTLAPGEVFNISEWIIAMNLNVLKIGSLNVTLQIPLVKDTMGYRVDGRDFVKNAQYLIFSGDVTVSQIVALKQRKKKVNNRE